MVGAALRVESEDVGSPAETCRGVRHVTDEIAHDLVVVRARQREAGNELGHFDIVHRRAPRRPGITVAVMTRRGHLCSRCGAIVPPVDVAPGERATGACPDCGLGFAVSAMTSFRKADLTEEELAERRRAAAVAMRERWSATLAQCDFTVYALDATWGGARSFGGSSSSDNGLNSITLTFGDPYEHAGPLARIESFRPSPVWELGVGRLASSLAEQYWSAGGEYTDALRSTFREADATVRWDDLVVSVDGRRRRAKSLGDDDRWVAVLGIDTQLVGIDARGIRRAGVALAPVDGFGPYLGDVPFPR